MHPGSTISTKRSRLRALLGGSAATIAAAVALLPAAAQAEVVGTHVVTPSVVTPHVVTPAPAATSAPAPAPAASPTPTPASAPAAGPEPGSNAPPAADPQPRSEKASPDDAPAPDPMPPHIHPPTLIPRPSSIDPDLPDWISGWAGHYYGTTFYYDVEAEVRNWVSTVLTQALSGNDAYSYWAPVEPDTAPPAGPTSSPEQTSTPAPDGPSSTPEDGSTSSSPLPEDDRSTAPTASEYGSIATAPEDSCQCSYGDGGDGAASGGGHWRSDEEDPTLEQN